MNSYNICPTGKFQNAKKELLELNPLLENSLKNIWIFKRQYKVITNI